MMSISTPYSSRISRFTALTSVSPNSTLPPGVSQQPRSFFVFWLLFERKSSPFSLKIIAPADTPIESVFLMLMVNGLYQRVLRELFGVVTVRLNYGTLTVIMQNRSRFIKTQGIVLKRTNYAEKDRIITLITPEFGKMKVLAKGVRKVPSRRAGHLEVFTHGEFSLYKGKTFEHVAEVTTLTSFPNIVVNLTKASFSYYVAELTDRLIPEKQEAEEVFDRLLYSLSTIDAAEKEEEYHKEIYEYALDLLWILGYLPRTQRIPVEKLTSHIEEIIERKLKTPKLLEKTG